MRNDSSLGAKTLDGTVSGSTATLVACGNYVVFASAQTSIRAHNATGWSAWRTATVLIITGGCESI